MTFANHHTEYRRTIRMQTAHVSVRSSLHIAHILKFQRAWSTFTDGTVYARSSFTDGRFSFIFEATLHGTQYLFIIRDN